MMKSGELNQQRREKHLQSLGPCVQITQKTKWSNRFELTFKNGTKINRQVTEDEYNNIWLYETRYYNNITIKCN